MKRFVIKVGAGVMLGFCTLQASAEELPLWDALTQHCGKAYAGRVTKDTEPSDTWANAHIVMHVRDCSDSQIKIPLHVDKDRSRVWVLTKLDGGKLRLKHDHRHADGTSDAVTMYGGTSEGPSEGVPAGRSFPVDQESITMFNANGLTASTANTWHLTAGQDAVYYRLTRPSGREFEVRIDLSVPVENPPAAWDIAPTEAPH